jgi:hypothetical protein
MTYLLTNQIFRISEKAWNTHFVYDDDALNGKGKIDRINKKERERERKKVSAANVNGLVDIMVSQ